VLASFLPDSSPEIRRRQALIPENLLQSVLSRVRIRATEVRIMVEQLGNSDKGGNTAVGKVVGDFVDRLSEEQRMLVILKSQLYGGAWEPMLDDLRNRLAGKPYIFKLASRIKDDIERIEQMQAFEAEHNVDLADYVEMP
jgi:hypothetical protein